MVHLEEKNQEDNFFNMKDEILKWWLSKWRSYNIIAFLSGVICLLVLYLAAIYFKHPFYFFFMLPSGVLYLVFLNGLYWGSAFLYFFSTKKGTLLNDNVTIRLKTFAIVLYGTIFLNILLLIICLFEFGIIT